ncbi:MAG TPA: DUF6624 domain-containing protein [Hymenobacter sp.]|uniref:DUF6624 domain-containing protein n=1 Tax=Hymenobacter sp. TaxID=1898978 RepID=UPI002D80DF47|nr:DUF6624 domain-containing protein [Hymenobacter sp.]HET9503843.1 DUF6624 domain-containing protein [Hymenobacter sp.]
MAAYKGKRYQESGQCYEQSFRQPGVQPAAGDFYNAACSWALAGESAKAFQNLNRAIKAGWDNAEHLKTDSDLDSLHADKRWAPMLNKLQAAAARAEAKLNQPLKRELTSILESDQSLRRQIAPTQQKYGPKSPQMDSLWKQMQRADARNLPRVTDIIDQYGWPGKRLVGRSGSLAAFFVIQHSNLATMQKYLPLMRVAAAKGELEKQNLVLLEDRVLTSQDKPQLYGSQYRYNASTGKPEFFPIADEAHVDERRASMGLEPLADYAKNFGLDYHPAAKQP